jgi:ubiquinone/menaquinone biosynthesis C-methylase UbiE
MMTRQAFFNNIAGTWDKRFHTQELLTFLEAFVPKFGLKRGQRVLDVGTGTGLLVPFLLQAIGASGYVTAIDYAEKMVKICKTKYAQFPNVTVAHQNVEELNLPSGSFDAVICFGVFPHIENKKSALDQMNRVLKPEGKLIIAHALSSEEVRKHHSNAAPAVAHDVLSTKEEMKKLLTQAGFAKIRIVDKPGQYLSLSFKLHSQMRAADK